HGAGVDGNLLVVHVRHGVAWRLGAAQLEMSFLRGVARDGGDRVHLAVDEPDATDELCVVYRAETRLEGHVERGGSRTAVDRAAGLAIVDVVREVRLGQSAPRLARGVEAARANRACGDAGLGGKRELHRLATGKRGRGRAVGRERDVNRVRRELPSGL